MNFRHNKNKFSKLDTQVLSVGVKNSNLQKTHPRHRLNSSRKLYSYIFILGVCKGVKNEKKILFSFKIYGNSN